MKETITGQIFLKGTGQTPSIFFYFHNSPANTKIKQMKKLEFGKVL